MDRLTHAKFYATQHHVVKHGQMYGVLPYTHHLADVERVLRRFGPANSIYMGLGHEGDGYDRSTLDEDMLVAAWLHDIVEDTEVKRRDVEELFGEQVSRLVEAVTSEEGANRKVRTALTYPKTRAAGAPGVRLKLADRIANVENGGASVGMYRKEYPDFRRGLHTPAQNDDMWSHLDRLMDWNCPISATLSAEARAHLEGDRRPLGF
jgi:(p)ppGpp synthase/HD superfamily hydrolase